MPNSVVQVASRTLRVQLLPDDSFQSGSTFRPVAFVSTCCSSSLKRREWATAVAIRVDGQIRWSRRHVARHHAKKKLTKLFFCFCLWAKISAAKLKWAALLPNWHVLISAAVTLKVRPNDCDSCYALRRLFFLFFFFGNSSSLLRPRSFSARYRRERYSLETWRFAQCFQKVVPHSGKFPEQRNRKNQIKNIKFKKWTFLTNGIAKRTKDFPFKMGSSIMALISNLNPFENWRRFKRSLRNCAPRSGRFFKART